MSVIAALLRAEHDLAFLHGCHVTDRPDMLPDALHWVIDHAETLLMIRGALESIGVSNETGRECSSCRNRPSRMPE